MISSATKLVCCHPPNAKRTGTSAAPRARKTEPGGFAGVAAPVRGVVRKKAAITSPVIAASFRRVKTFWVHAAGRTPTMFTRVNSTIAPPAAAIATPECEASDSGSEAR